MDFLGVWFNSLMGTMSITPNRLVEIQNLIQTWLGRNACTRNELEQLLGKLQFVGSCVRPARIFISRMLQFLRGMDKSREYIIPHEMKKDLRWWAEFLLQYNGVSIMWMEHDPEPDVTMATDASLVGIGGIWKKDEFYRIKLPKEWMRQNIAYLELIAICVALKVWGQKCRGLRIKMYCDNESVVQVINTGRAHDHILQDGCREVCWLAAKYQFEIRLTHISSRRNVIPDLLSRWPLGGKVRQQFRQINQQLRMSRANASITLLRHEHNW